MNQQLIQSQMDGVTARVRTVNGQLVSLSDLGYKDVGLDDNWQLCGRYGPNNYTFHDANGRPVVNKERFPDFIAMTTYAHSKNLTAGWYGNNCICSDHCSDDSCYYGDVQAVLDYGFDSIKLDGCGQQRDLTLYASLFEAAGASILIENCHWGGTTPNATWCPWNYFRSSGDIEASYGSVVGNLQTTIQWANSGLSKPGCWAYPDMLEVGVFADPVHPSAGGLTLTEMKSHFNAWCVVSSPLILSHDTNNGTVSDAIWPIISNTEAIAVNQAWNGFSGGPFAQASETVELGAKYGAAPAWQIFYKPVDATHTAVLMMNHQATSASMSFQFSQVPGLTCTTCKLRDIANHADLGSFNGQYAATVGSHDSVFLLISTQ